MSLLQTTHRFLAGRAAAAVGTGFFAFAFKMKNFLETEVNYHFLFLFINSKVAKKGEKRITLPLRYNLGIAEKLNFLKNVREAAVARPCTWLSPFGFDVLIWYSKFGC